MYLEHFGLREAPFRITPHTEFFFAGAHRGATLEALIYAITHDEGIVKVSGEVGSGKTMLCRMLLERLPASVATVYLPNPALTRNGILFTIADELEAPRPDGPVRLLLRGLQEKLVELYGEGKLVVVLIDEAQAMPAEALEELRLLSNLESSRHKLLRIVLFGQLELDKRLADAAMRPLKERITHNFVLERLHRAEVGDYLMFRIRAAGYRGADLFAPRAIELIARASEGLTRRINILGDKALLAAYAENRRLIDKKQIRAAIRDAQFTAMHGRRKLARFWVGGAGFVAVIAVAVLLAFVAAPYLADSASPPGVASRPPSPSPAASFAASPGESPTPAGAIQALAASLPAAASDTAPPSAPVVTGAAPTLKERIAATDAWIKATAGSHYFIQLLATDAGNEREVEDFLEHRPAALDPAQLRVYRWKRSGRDRLGVIYGDYASVEAASAELARLATKAPMSGAYVRSVSRLK